MLWGHHPERTERLRATRENADYLPGVKMPSSVQVTSDLSDCMGADLVVVVTPSTAVRSITQSIQPFVSNEAVFLSCTKGIEHGTLSLMTDVVADELPGRSVVAFSGPSFAAEVAPRLRHPGVS